MFANCSDDFLNYLNPVNQIQISFLSLRLWQSQANIERNWPSFCGVIFFTYISLTVGTNRTNKRLFG